MPSMNIIKEKWDFLNLTSNHVPKQVIKLYKFGVQVLAFRAITSLRANARIPNLNWHTAKSKIYRLTKNPKFLKIFPQLVKALHIVRAKDIIAVDFSDFGGGFQVLMFAKQTKRGRAIPVYFEIIKYPIKRGSQNLFIIQAIKNFEAILGFKMKLVFDRGFACPSIIRFLAKNRHVFYIRIKKAKKSIDIKTGQAFKACQTKEDDLEVAAYGLERLRLVISDKTGVLEPWYIITNDFRSKRETVIKTYYHRFEIEEFFRDAKRLLGLEYINFKTITSLQITLWFVCLGIWFIWSLKEKLHDKRLRDKMQLSLMRYYLEKIHSEIIILAEGRFMKEFLADTG
jgi:hypothetical protein